MPYAAISRRLQKHDSDLFPAASSVAVLSSGAFNPRVQLIAAAVMPYIWSGSAQVGKRRIRAQRFSRLIFSTRVVRLMLSSSAARALTPWLRSMAERIRQRSMLAMISGISSPASVSRGQEI